MELPAGIVIEKVPVAKRYRSVAAGLLERTRTLYDRIQEKVLDSASLCI